MKMLPLRRLVLLRSLMSLTYAVILVPMRPNTTESAYNPNEVIGCKLGFPEGGSETRVFPSIFIDLADRSDLSDSIKASGGFSWFICFILLSSDDPIPQCQGLDQPLVEPIIETCHGFQAPRAGSLQVTFWLENRAERTGGQEVVPLSFRLDSSRLNKPDPDPESGVPKQRGENFDSETVNAALTTLERCKRHAERTIDMGRAPSGGWSEEDIDGSLAMVLPIGYGGFALLRGVRRSDSFESYKRAAKVLLHNANRTFAIEVEAGDEAVVFDHNVSSAIMVEEHRAKIRALVASGSLREGHFVGSI